MLGSLAFALLLNEADELSEAVVQLDACLALSLLLLQLVHIGHALAGSLVIQIICSYTRFLKELHVVDLFSTDGNRSMKVEVYNNNQLIISTALEKRMLYVSECNIHIMCLSRCEPHSVLMNL